MIPIYINTDTLIRVDKLKNENTGSYVNDATVVMTLYEDEAGATAVSGATSLQFEYVTSSDGRYHGNIPDSLSLVEGTIYWLFITTTIGTLKRTDKLQGEAVYADGD